MSQFLPDQFKEQETAKTRTPQQGPESYLSPEERKFWQRGLGFPEDFPPKFKSWLIDFIAVNIPQIPISQIIGFNQVDQVEVSTNTAPGSVTTASGSYVSLSGGPSLSGLRSGQYVIFHGCTLANTGGVRGFKAFQSVSVNAATALDADAVQFNVGSNADETASVSTTLVKSFTDSSNSLECKYKIGIAGTCFAFNRWLIAQRIGPVPAS